MAPTVGRIVHYRLSFQDVQRIRQRRRLHESEEVFTGNPVEEGEVAPMLVVAVWGPTCVNGHVLLDGYDSLWVTSVVEGTDPGAWSWPPREG